jgi:hypothetical protein
MKGFKKYQHVERFGNQEVEGIELGNCHVFPKIDGTNGSIWKEGDGLHFASRKRELIDDDNQGFKAALQNDKCIIDYFNKHPEHRLFGEWLIPHSLKTYRDDAWRRFYVFDVTVDTEDSYEYLPYEVYKPMLEEFGIDYIPLQAYVKNGTYEQFVKLLDQNTFLVKDGMGPGEGIVIKNYSYRNKYGRIVWAKIVRAEFKEVHSKTMGAPIVEGKKMVEEQIVEKYVTTAVIEKEFEKIKTENDGWSSKFIPQLLGRVYHALITEDIWNAIKDFKNPKIDFKTLNHLTIQKIKTEKQEIFS